MFFYNSKNQSTPTIKMTIDCDGKVGIGTDSPVYTLHVNGSIATSGDNMVFNNDGSLDYT